MKWSFSALRFSLLVRSENGRAWQFIFTQKFFLKFCWFVIFVILISKFPLTRYLSSWKINVIFQKRMKGSYSYPILCECLILIPVESIKLQDVQKGSICLKWDIIAAQPRFTCSKSTIKTPEECVESAQN